MVTRGEISLDVEDNLGPFDWPQVNDVSSDAIKHSVHFPLIPNVRISCCTFSEPMHFESMLIVENSTLTLPSTYSNIIARNVAIGDI